MAKLLGKLGYRRKEYRYAVQLLQESLRGQPADAESFFYLGLAHYKLKERPQSKEALQRAVALNIQTALATEANRLIAELQ